MFPIRLGRVLLEAVRQAAASATGNPLRSGLAALAVGVAVAAVVVVVTAIDGVERYARTVGARAFGSQTFLVAQIASSGRVNRRELAEKLQRNPPVRRNDLRFLEQQTGARLRIASTSQVTGDVTNGGRTFENAVLVGTTASLADLRDLGIGTGRFFTREEERRGASVAIVGAEIAETLFPSGVPQQPTLRLAGRRFDIIGIQQRLGSSGGGTLDRSVYIPWPAFERAVGAPTSLNVFASPVDVADTSVAEDLARAAMRARRQLLPGVADTFDILTPEAARTFVQNIASRVGAAAGPLSAMALLAAIVVVTNTMLVSVTQRTREIGVRRALGASRAQVMREVVAESLLVSLVGGMVGMGLTAVAVSAVSAALGLETRVNVSTVVWALVAAAIAGLAAGYYPALKATRVDIITAVRTE